MLRQNIFFVATKTVLVDIIGEAAYFPVWWYTSGLKHTALTRFKNIATKADNLAIRLLVLNIFKPMFAQYDRAGRIISFFMRIVILVYKLIYLIIYSILELVILALWVVFPLFVVYRLVIIYGLSYAGF